MRYRLRRKYYEINGGNSSEGYVPRQHLSEFDMSLTILSKVLPDQDGTFLKTQQQTTEKTSPMGHQSRLAQYSERLSGPLPLVDEFCGVPAEQLESGVREAKGLRGLLRQMGGSPVMCRRTARSHSQN